MASRWSKTHRLFAPHAVEDVDLAPSSPLAIWGLFQGKTRGHPCFFQSKIIKYSYMTLIDVIQGSSVVLLDMLLSIRANYQSKSTILRCRILKFSKWLRTGLSPSATVTEFRAVSTNNVLLVKIEGPGAGIPSIIIETCR